LNHIGEEIMETNITTSPINEPTQKLLPWHKPEVQQLSISLDTAAGCGSGTDGSFQTSIC
jgi:hypothetical protein